MSNQYLNGTTGQPVPEFMRMESKNLWIHGEVKSCTLCAPCCASCMKCKTSCLKCKTCDCCADCDSYIKCCKLDSIIKCKTSCESCKASCLKCKSCDFPSCDKCLKLDSIIKCKTSCLKCKTCDFDSCAKCKTSCITSCGPSCLKCASCECCDCGPELNCRAVGCELCPGPLKPKCGNWHLSTHLLLDKCPAFLFPLCPVSVPCIPCLGGKDENYDAGNNTFTLITDGSAPKSTLKITLGRICFPADMVPSAISNKIKALFDPNYVAPKEDDKDDDAKKETKKAASDDNATAAADDEADEAPVDNKMIDVDVHADDDAAPAVAVVVAAPAAVVVAAPAADDAAPVAADDAAPVADE